jgi:hypothetical protein
MPVYQIIEEIPAIAFRALIVVADNEQQALDLYNEGSYIEEMKWFEEDESTISTSITQAKAN